MQIVDDFFHSKGDRYANLRVQMENCRSVRLTYSRVIRAVDFWSYDDL